ncbi:hypothetical protein BDW22DRAFT_1343761 [Trametopsis cervina]|nr:hypothetical protein BDW22DRAFT_1343761 [Trametopsis cervina]
MPSTSRAQKAEAKYNVVLEFPNYGLHTAASSGNLGLVKYALEHGQPVNSALDGILPLHAACHGGSDLIVRFLIEYGADVNAPRLPRRYTTDKHRPSTPSLSISASSGSTPLHFACIHGHSTVVMTLLLHGAHPDRPDKHGITPEMLARQKGFNDCADVLREWSHNKDKDLREREAVGPHPHYSEDSSTRESHPYCGSLECRECATRKRIRMKRSIDNAIHILRHSPSQGSTMTTPPHSSASGTMQPPSPATDSPRPLGEYTFYPTNDSAIDDFPPRRPSLPQVLEVPRASTSSNRSRRPSNMSTSSRPRSAGTDAEPSTRVRGKLSLLNIFKKANEVSSTPESNSSSAVTSASVSPSPGSGLLISRVSGQSSEMLVTANSDVSLASNQSSSRTHHRLFSEGAATRVKQVTESNDSGSHSVVRERLQSSSATHDGIGTSSPPVRPGILRAHGRSSSSGQSTPQTDTTRSVSGTQSSLRALRFDSTTSTQSSHSHRAESIKRAARHESRSPSRRLQEQGSVSSLRPGSPRSTSFGLRLESEPEALPAPSILSEHPSGGIEEEDEEDEEDEEYGRPVSPQVGMSDVEAERHLPKRLSTQSAVSEVDSQDTLHHAFSCPFSINEPPPAAEEEEELAAEDVQAPGRSSTDSRMRGNSLSSMVTDSSVDPPSSCVPTPSIQQSTLPGPLVFAPSSVPTEPNPFEAVNEHDESLTPVDTPSPAKRSRAALDIDIRSISTHAQAEALVARAQQRILTHSNDLDEEEIKTLGLNVGEGHTPLSARLAAYGESLAIERKFKQEQQEQKRRSLLANSVSSSTLMASRSNDSRESQKSYAAQLDRHGSLQERHRRATEGDWQRPTNSDDALPASVTHLMSSPPPRHDATSISNPEPAGNLHHSFNSPGISITPPADADRHARSESLLTERSTGMGISMGIARSRTPDPGYYDSLTHGVPLTRYQTCPTEDGGVGTSKVLRSGKERQAARAQKLAKMGFSSGGSADTWREASTYSQRPPQRHRFGGIKTLVQSLTGKA